MFPPKGHLATEITENTEGNHPKIKNKNRNAKVREFSIVILLFALWILILYSSLWSLYY